MLERDPYLAIKCITHKFWLPLAFY